jgi:DNA repair ATPase RecN
MRTLVLLAALFSPAALAHAATVNATINECSRGNDHPRVSQCVSECARSARSALDAAERAMRARIEQSDDDASHLEPIRRRFEASAASYRQYRGEQCGLHQALSSMSVYTQEIGLACEAMLDSDRARQLEQGMPWLE